MRWFEGHARVTPEAVRQAIYFLGSRHHGNALGGARLELQSDGLTNARRRLLEAVVFHLAPGGTAPPVPSSAVPNVSPLGVATLAAVVAAAMTIVTMFLR
jgi:hypothetical protein